MLCVGSQLVELNQHAAAAQMLLSADLVQEAVEVLMAAGEWNKARKIAQQLEPRYIFQSIQIIFVNLS